MKETQTGTDEEAWKSGDHGFVVGVDPVGSILAQNGKGEISGYEVVSLRPFLFPSGDLSRALVPSKRPR